MLDKSFYVWYYCIKERGDVNMKLDLTDYLSRYPQKENEDLEDYKDRIYTNLREDYSLQYDMIDKLISLMFKDKE